MNKEKKLIALYLPQYHPTPRNDRWWGKGFTEWTNVGKAKPLFPGHYQPHVPADLGYYDLRLPEIRKAQADMAREHGVYGFCYYHYWFEAGFEELERPLDEIVRLGEPDFPFCVCWANETWYSKFWNIDGTIQKKPLAEQKYLGTEDNIAHFYRLLPVFKDKRYITKSGRLVFVIYRPFDFVGLEQFMKEWNDLARENGLNGFYFIAHTTAIAKCYQQLKDWGFEEIISVRIYSMGAHKSFFDRVRNRISRSIFRRPEIIDYAHYYENLVGFEESKEDVIPTIVPNWDHTPRSANGGMVYVNSTPQFFEKHVAQVCDILDNKQSEDSFCFLKSWNEWGEGNYVEPDLKYGYGYLNVLKKYYAHQ